jgi:hypothetical protein
MTMTSIIERLAFANPEEEASFEASGMEYENEIYISGYDLNQIVTTATYHEGQEQWGIFVPKSDQNASSGSIRVRMTEHEDASVVYEQTTKTDAKEKGKLENERPSDEVMFGQFKLMADQGLIKMRYVIEAQTRDGEPFKFEVDIFRNGKGEVVPWAKIDAELPDGYELTPEEIPFTHDELIILTPAMKVDRQAEVNKKVAKLYETYFRSPNVHV